MYKNYGDVDFLEHGRLVDMDRDTASVLFCEPVCDSDGKYLFALCEVCLDDVWIDWRAISDFTGGWDFLEPDDIGPCKAVDAIEYHGAENFGTPELLTRDEVIRRVEAMGVLLPRK